MRKDGIDANQVEQISYFLILYITILFYCLPKFAYCAKKCTDGERYEHYIFQKQ